eukprot:14961065-Alexandrium_andersonii.AAC.1
MSASLVGSEMCIRDSCDAVLVAGAAADHTNDTVAVLLEGLTERLLVAAVSYTHLTLPTICSV